MLQWTWKYGFNALVLRLHSYWTVVQTDLLDHRVVLCLALGYVCGGCMPCMFMLGASIFSVLFSWYPVSHCQQSLNLSSSAVLKLQVYVTTHDFVLIFWGIWTHDYESHDYAVSIHSQWAFAPFLIVLIFNCLMNLCNVFPKGSTIILLSIGQKNFKDLFLARHSGPCL